MTSEISNYMRFALNQAFLAVGVSRPNPAVGAIVVKDGIVVGKGHTQCPGSAHAEVMALRDAGELACGASICVTLEPCCHYGRTPPCTKAIIEARIKKVYFAHSDPNPVVHGKSRSILEEAGIEVYEGLDACVKACAEECPNGESAGECRVFEFRSLSLEDRAIREGEGREIFHEIERFYEAYDYFVRSKRTFVEVKSAISQDGFMGCIDAAGKLWPLTITKAGANCWNHELRAMSDAILVGAGTLLADNPRLDVRHVAGNNPVKIIWAGHHEFTADEILHLNVFQAKESKPLVYSCVAQPKVGLAQALFSNSNSDDSSESCEAPLWNRFDLWRSTDPSVDETVEHLVAKGVVTAGLEYPDLPASIVAKESAVIGADVLTVYYP